MNLPLDIEQFWKDEETAHDENCFSKNAKQVALGIRMGNHCVFSELGEEGQPYGFTDPDRQYELNCRYNEKAIQIVGRPLLEEIKPAPKEVRHAYTIPQFKQIGEVFGGEYYYNGNSVWLHSNIDTPEALAKQLDKVSAITKDPEAFRKLILPADWDEKCKLVYETCGKRPNVFKKVRGPVTLATSIFGVENLIYLFYDDEGLFTHFADVIGDVLLSYIDLFIKESGNAPDCHHGFTFNDDDCNLFTPEMYEKFGYRVLKRVFEKTAPNPEDYRYQHSDSAMAHLLPLLADFNLTGCNFGPTISVQEIRKHMPNTRIDGQMAPFTFMRNNEEQIIAEVKRDCEAAKENDLRGLNFKTAGSINDGSLLTSMRAVMAAIQNYGRY